MFTNLIPGVGQARLILAGVAVASLVGGVLYLRHHWISQGEASGRADVQARWDIEREEIARQRALQEAEARAKEEADRQAAKEVQDALQEKLDSADARARDLARRLYDYQARLSALQLSRPADPATGADSPTGVPEDGGAVGQLLEEHLAACARDAERLSGWQDWWGRVGVP